MSVQLLGPPTSFGAQIVAAPSGTTYQVDATGLVRVANLADVPFLIENGFIPYNANFNASITTSPLISNASANTAAINAALAQGGDYYISGTVPINGSLLNGGRFGARLFGAGGWGSTTLQNVGGTVLYWVGPPGLPMYVHQPNFGGGVRDVLFKGNSSAPPLCAILLDTGKYSVVTNSYSNPLENKNCTEGIFDNIWIGQTFSQGADTDQSNSQFTNGIMFSGTINGDTNKFGMVFIAGVTGVGVYNQNPNAAAISIDTLLVKFATNSIDTISGLTIKNLYCHSTDFNLLLRDTAQVDIDTYFAEDGGGIFKFLAGTITNYNLNQEQSLWIRNGNFQMLQTGNTTPYVGDVTTSNLWNLRLDDFNFSTPFVSPQTPIINLISSVDNLRHGKHIIDIKSSTINLNIGTNIIDGPVATISPKYFYCAGRDNSAPAVSPGFVNADGVSTNSSTAADLQLHSGDIYAGEARTHTLQLTGGITAASVATLPSVASLLTAFPNPVVGQTYRLRVVNNGGSGSGAWTISGTYTGSYDNLTGGGTPTFDTSTQQFGTAALLTGYGFTSTFPAWPGTSGTIQAWIKLAAPPSGNQFIVGLDNGSTTTFSVAVLATSGFINYAFYSGVTQYSYTDTLNVCDGAWHLIEMDLGATQQLFIDGVLRKTTSTQVPNANQGANFCIGARPRVFSGEWTGEIDEVSVWNTALHTVTYTPPVSAWTGSESNLVDLYHLDGDFTSAVIPLVGGGWTLTGNMVVPINGWNDFYVTIGASTTATLQSIGGSTLSPAFTPPVYPGPANDFTAEGTFPVGETILWGVTAGGIPNAVRLTTDGNLAGPSNCLNMPTSISSMVVTMDVYVEGPALVSAMWSSVSIYAYRSGASITLGSVIPTGNSAAGAISGFLQIMADSANLGVNVTYIAGANQVTPLMVIARARTVLMGAPSSTQTKPISVAPISTRVVNVPSSPIPIGATIVSQNQMGPNYNSGTPANSGPW